MLIRFLQLLIFSSVFAPSLAQVYDNFSDGDHNNDPVWTGDQSDFEIDSNEELHLLAPVAGTSHLSTANVLFDKVVWEFKVQLDFNPSSSNLAKIYLVSDQADLEGSLDGYYIMVGDTEDEISLYKQEGLTSSYVINGPDGSVTGSPDVRIKVIRDQMGGWSLYQDLTGGYSYEYVGSGVDIDPGISNTNYFGFLCDYTVTRADKFYFDDVVIDQLRFDSINVRNDTAIEVQFNQYLLESELTDISNFSIGGIIISESKRVFEDSSRIVISLDPLTPLESGEYSLFASENLTLNSIEEAEFSYEQLLIDTVLTLSDNQILVDFNGDLDILSTEEILNYEIDQGIGNPTSAEIDPIDNSQVVLTLAGSLTDGITYELTAGAILNRSLNSEFSDTVNFAFIVPILIQSVEILSADSLMVEFNKTIDPESVIASNFSVDLGIGNPISSVPAENGSSVYLVFGARFEQGTYELVINNLMDPEGFEIVPGTSTSFSYLPMKIVSVSQSDFETVEIFFNQKADEISGEKAGHFVIQGFGSPTSAIVSAVNDSVIYLKFPQLINSSYHLIVDKVENLELNATIDKDTLIFDFEKPTPFRAVQINEIMADFSPSAGLPEAEYVELFNPGLYPVQLYNFLLNGESIPRFTIPANGFVTLTDDSNTGLFDEASTAYLSSFDALTNTADSVILRDQFGDVVDSLFYTLEWYRDSEKDDGGFSLEQINSALACSDETNWIASADMLGGTPGEVNSSARNEPDHEGPLISEIEVVSGDTLLITFDEPVAPETVTVQKLSISDDGIRRITRRSYRQFELILNKPLMSEAWHKAVIMNISDCQGNVTLNDSISFYYDSTAPVLNEIIVVSAKEIALTFHESLKESVAENEENFLLGQEFGFPARAILQDSASHRIQLIFDSLFQVGINYLLTVSNLSDTLGNVIDSRDIIFEFLDQVDSAYVVAPNLINVKFSEVPEFPIQASSFLVSKEIGNPTAIDMDVDHPKLIRLGFDKNLSSNTDYQLYFQHLYSAETSEKLITPARSLIYDTRAPRIVDLLVPDSSQVLIIWDEPINWNSAFSSIQYEISGYGSPIDLSAMNNHQIILTFDFYIPEEEDLTLKVSGIEDMYRNRSGTISREFIHDTKPPEIRKIKVIDPGFLSVIISEKADASSVFESDNFFIEGRLPTSIDIRGPDSLSIILEFTEIPESVEQLISIRGLKDQYQNQIDSSGYYFNSLNPSVSHIVFLSDSVIGVSFSREMTTDIFYFSSYSVVDNSIREINSISTSKVELILDEKFTEGDSVHLKFHDLTDLSGNALMETGKLTIFKTYFDGWKRIDPKTLEITFDTEFSNVTKEQFLLDGSKPTLLQIDAENRGIIRMVFADSLPANRAMNFYWSNLEDRYQRRIPDQHIQIIIDSQSPKFISIESDFHNRINLFFNETLSSNSLSPNHFKMLENVALKEFQSESKNAISLLFDELVNDQEYHLLISGVSDISGNFIDADTINFRYQVPYLPGPGDIIITEIMADPAPSAGLPEIEYIELFNASDSVIQLNSLLISDRTAQEVLPKFVFQPQTYLVLSAGVMEGSIDITGFPGLDNSGDSLTLSNIAGEIIDVVVYARDWYGDTEKDDGGYSLELINPESECPGVINWGASTDVKGGTPGARNSIYSLSADAEPPTLLNYQLYENHIELFFSESLDRLSILAGEYQIDALNISLSGISTGYSDLISISFSTPLQYGEMYELEVSGPGDCSGNQLTPFTIKFGLGARPEFNDLIISEIMPDPDPVLDLPNSEYLEIYNRTDKLISLEDVKIRDGGGEMELPSITISGNEYVVLVPTNAVNQFEQEVIGVPNWRSLGNDGESLAIFHNDELIFNVEYSSSWHSIETDGGISLEIRDVDNPCAGALNWGSSESFSGGTPGIINSIAESIPDNFGPELVDVDVLSDATIRLTFNEQLLFDEVTYEQLEILPGPLQISEILMDTLKRDHFLVNLQGQLMPNVNYIVTLNQVFDCLGNLISDNELDFVLPEQADRLDIIINEVLFNPREDGFDFVEIYNRSDKNIDLKDWKLGRQFEDRIASFMVTEGSYILEPSEYLALTADPKRVITDYPQAKEERIFQINSLVNYPNETAKIVLADSEDQIIDAFEYHEDMHLSLLESVDGVSLERISFDQPTQDENNWQSASSTVGFATPGYQNSQALEVSAKGILTIEPKVFVPANFGSTVTQDFTTINYQLSSTGQLANVNVYNRNGQLVKNLGSGISLASNGFLRWDGTTDGGSVASMGYYLIVFELFDGSGYREILKETVVVGR